MYVKTNQCMKIRYDIQQQKTTIVLRAGDVTGEAGTKTLSLTFDGGVQIPYMNKLYKLVENG